MTDDYETSTIRRLAALLRGHAHRSPDRSTSTARSGTSSSGPVSDDAGVPPARRSPPPLLPSPSSSRRACWSPTTTGPRCGRRPPSPLPVDRDGNDSAGLGVPSTAPPSTPGPTSTNSTTATSSSTPTTSATAGTPATQPRPTPAAPSASTYTSAGGSIVVTLANGAVSLADDPSPSPGWSYRIDDDGPSRVRVRFERDGQRSEIRVDLQGDQLVPDITEADPGGDPTGRRGASCQRRPTPEGDRR